MAKRVRRSFRSHRTDVRKRSKFPSSRKRMTRAQKLAKADRRQTSIAKKVAASEPRLNGESMRMREQTVRCQCIVGGRKVWAGAKDKSGRPIIRNGKPVRYPAIIIPDENPDGHRCDEQSVTSKRRNGQTIHTCARHVGVWYVDEHGQKRDYDDQVIA
jgi:hypothetical protein